LPTKFPAVLFFSVNYFLGVPAAEAAKRIPHAPRPSQQIFLDFFCLCDIGNKSRILSALSLYQQKRKHTLHTSKKSNIIMIGFLKNLFGGGASNADFKALLQKGAIILDVRTPAEFQGGHIKGAINIPVQVLEQQLSKLPKDRPIITCCASGMRSGSAQSLLHKKGYEVYNGGGWGQLQQALT
jgi:phage shock protein E